MFIRVASIISSRFFLNDNGFSVLISVNINFVSTSALSNVFAISIAVFNASARSANNRWRLLLLINPRANLSCNALSKNSLKLHLQRVISGLSWFLATESPLEMMKNAFCFILQALFFLKIIKFLFWFFGHVQKRLDLIRLISKFMTSQTGKQTIATHATHFSWNIILKKWWKNYFRDPFLKIQIEYISGSII